MDVRLQQTVERLTQNDPTLQKLKLEFSGIDSHVLVAGPPGSVSPTMLLVYLCDQVLCRQVEKREGSPPPCIWQIEGETFAILFAGGRLRGAIRKTNGFVASPEKWKKI